MKNPSASRFMVLAALALIGANVASARDIVCAIPKAEKTVNGIRGLHFHKDDWKGYGEIRIIRDGKSEEVRDYARMDTELSWDETLRLTPASGDYALSESVYVSKRMNPNGASTYSLMKVQTRTYGENCDGAHMCAYESKVVESAPIACADSHDEIRATPTPRCPDQPHGDCY